MAQALTGSLLPLGIAVCSGEHQPSALVPEAVGYCQLRPPVQLFPHPGGFLFALPGTLSQMLSRQHSEWLALLPCQDAKQHVAANSAAQQEVT